MQRLECLVVGEPGVGKTTWLSKLSGATLDPGCYRETLTVGYHVVGSSHGARPLRIDLKDTPGHLEFLKRLHADHYAERYHLVICMYAIDSLDSLRLLEGHVTHLKLSLPEPRPPMVLLGNKKDRERQHREVSLDAAAAFAQRHGLLLPDSTHRECVATATHRTDLTFLLHHLIDQLDLLKQEEAAARVRSMRAAAPPLAAAGANSSSSDRQSLKRRSSISSSSRSSSQAPPPHVTRGGCGYGLEGGEEAGSRRRPQQVAVEQHAGKGRAGEEPCCSLM